MRLRAKRLASLRVNTIVSSGNRKSGGGYEAFDPDNEQAKTLRRQAAVGLYSWLNRYRGCVEHVGIDVSSIENIAEELRGNKEDVA